MNICFLAAILKRNIFYIVFADLYLFEVCTDMVLISYQNTYEKELKMIGFK